MLEVRMPCEGNSWIKSKGSAVPQGVARVLLVNWEELKYYLHGQTI